MYHYPPHFIHVAVADSTSAIAARLGVTTAELTHYNADKVTTLYQGRRVFAELKEGDELRVPPRAPFLLAMREAGPPIALSFAGSVLDIIPQRSNLNVGVSGLLDDIGGLAGDAVGFVSDTVESGLSAAGGVVSKVVNAAGSVIETVTDAAGNVIEKITDIAGNITSKIVDVAGNVFTVVQTAAGKVAVEIVTKVGDVYKQTGLPFGGEIQTLTQKTGEFASKITDGAGSVITFVKNKVGDISGSVLNAAGQTVGGLDVVKKIIDPVTGAFSQVFDRKTGAVVGQITDAKGSVVDQTGKYLGQLDQLKDLMTASQKLEVGNGQTPPPGGTDTPEGEEKAEGSSTWKWVAGIGLAAVAVGGGYYAYTH